MKKMKHTKLILTVGAAVALTSACDDSAFDSDRSAPVTMSFATTADASAGLAASLSLVPITGGGHTLDLQSAELTLDELVLERDEGELNEEEDSDNEELGGDSDSDADSDSDGPGNEHFTSGPVTVQLPLDGTVVEELTVQVPTGSYEEVEMDIAAVRLTGEYDGEAFDVTLPLDLELETEFEPPLLVEDALNITISIDLAPLFTEADGSVVDPRVLESDDAARSRFMQRLALAVDSFEDSDRDGDDMDSDSDD